MSTVSDSGKGDVAAGSAVTGQGKAGPTALAMKGITLPTKGHGRTGQSATSGGKSQQPATGGGKSHVALDSVTPTLIQTPSRDTGGAPSRQLSLPRPPQQNLPRPASQSSSDADALSVRLDKIEERIQVLEQMHVFVDCALTAAQRGEQKINN